MGQTLVPVRGVGSNQHADRPPAPPAAPDVHAGDVSAAVAAHDPFARSDDPGSLDDKWRSGLYGHLAVAIVTLRPTFRIAVARRHGRVVHAAAYDPDTGLCYDGYGTTPLGAHLPLQPDTGRIETGLGRSDLADVLGIGFDRDRPWTNHVLHEAGLVAGDHWPELSGR